MSLRSSGDDSSKGELPTLATSEITLGRMVGQGGFSVVCPIESIELNDVYDTSDDGTKSRQAFAASMRNNRYVLKKMRTDLPEEEHCKGIVDLAIEADFLSVLSHQNIIDMRAIANSDPYEGNFFVILDRLVTTLDRKFNAWRKDVGENNGYWCGPFGYCCAKDQYLYTTWLERLVAAEEIANAIYYLHSKSIVYRDLKPDNLGFDANGTLKLFDFGLAKRLDPMDQTDDGMYYLTGNTGSLRYMSPEVARGEPYNQRVDAYSFGILFWQICSLQTPYAGFSTLMHAEKVVQQGQRPRPDSSWPLSWVDMMTRLWNANALERPDFDEIAVFLDEQVESLRNREGEIPTRASEIKAKKRKKPAVAARLDVDTRISTSEDTNVRRFEQEVV